MEQQHKYWACKYVDTGRMLTWLSQQKYVGKILRKFDMNNAKPIRSIWLSIVFFLRVYVLTDEEENGYMSQVLYASRRFDECDGEW